MSLRQQRGDHRADTICRRRLQEGRCWYVHLTIHLIQNHADEADKDMTDLEASLCGKSNNEAAPARHASKPMQPAAPMHMDMGKMMDHGKRAYSPSMDKDMAPAESAIPHVIYVTETRTDCSCKSTPAPDSMHISQIPVDVPASSSMGAMLAASSPAMSNGVMVGASSSSVLFGSQMSATPTPSGASPNRFDAFQGAAPAVNAVHGGAAALGVAAVMGLMIAL